MDKTMTTTTITATELSRKRSRLSPGLDDDHDDDTLKKTRTQCELDELNIISPPDAWRVDVDALLGQRPWPRYRKSRSTIVVCVQGNMQLHHDLLRYVVEIYPRLCTYIGERGREGGGTREHTLTDTNSAALPELQTLAPTLQALVLCHDPTTHPVSSSALPCIGALTPSGNHFVRLGLLHPLGGGTTPLDALAVVDRLGRRRLVLPFGWGAGKHVDTPAGRSIQVRLMGLLRHCVEALEAEAEAEI
jgi:hypothetical protein